MRGGKQKLTLSVDSGIVDQAKRAGVNISELTEQVLGGFAIEDDHLDWKSYQGQYLTFLKTMDPLLFKYGASVIIGDLMTRPGKIDDGYEGEVRYHGSGRFSIPNVEELLTLDELETTRYTPGLRDPGSVLRNLMQELEKAKLRRKEEIANLLIAGRIVEAIYQADSKVGVTAAQDRRRSSRDRGTIPDGDPAAKQSKSKSRSRASARA
jgi:Post-segregation antitoxin CcdA